VNTSGAAHDSFNVAAERQTGRYGDKPFITWYDDHRDERIELSYKTFGPATGPACSPTTGRRR
jgi:hypothetical protein